MSIARAFTTRRARRTLDRESVSSFTADHHNSSSGGFPLSVDSFLHRSKTAKSIRNKISGPVELTHTTNMLSYNAPDIVPGENISTASPKTNTAAAPQPMVASPPGSAGIKSDDEVSDSVSDSGETNTSTPPTSPDTPFPRNSDHKRSLSPEPNHLSCYFMPPKHASQTLGLGIAATASSEDVAPARSSSPAPFSSGPAPVIPQRAPSHTIRSSDEILRHRSRSFKSDNSSRSLSSKGSFSFSRSSSISTNTSRASSMSRQPSTKLVISSPIAVSSSVPLVTGAPPSTHKKEYSDAHPFGQELAQVSELVEELVKDEAPIEEEAEEEEDAETLLIRALLSEEEADMVRQGLKKYSAESYIRDIESMQSCFFAAEHVERPVAIWI